MKGLFDWFSRLVLLGGIVQVYLGVRVDELRPWLFIGGYLLLLIFSVRWLKLLYGRGKEKGGKLPMLYTTGLGIVVLLATLLIALLSTANEFFNDPPVVVLRASILEPSFGTVTSINLHIHDLDSEKNDLDCKWEADHGRIVDSDCTCGRYEATVSGRDTIRVRVADGPFPPLFSKIGGGEAQHFAEETPAPSSLPALRIHRLYHSPHRTY